MFLSNFFLFSCFLFFRLAGDALLAARADTIDIEREPLLAKAVETQFVHGLGHFHGGHLAYASTDGADLVDVVAAGVAGLIARAPNEAVAQTSLSLINKRMVL